MADKYKTWAELVAAEPDAFKITANGAVSDTSHIAIHAGSIEPGSGELAKAVAYQTGQALYCMEGTKGSDNQTLHITSTNFDEPTCIGIQDQVERTISYHGYSGDDLVTHIGGLDKKLAQAVGKSLEDAGFKVDYNPQEGIAGAREDNIANRNRSGQGVQLELSAGQRKAFFPDGDWKAADRDDPNARTPAFHQYVRAITKAIAKPIPSYNRMLVWDGSKWCEGKKVIWDGTKWVEKPSVQIWDGAEWMFKYPDPVYYPAWVDANGGIKDGEYRTFKLPKGMRLGDFVVTLCVSRDSMPQLLNPAGNLTATKQLASGTWVSCVMFRYDGEWNLRNGDSVRWKVPGGGGATIANYVYRGAETRDIPITPFHEVKEYAKVSEVPLNSPAGNTTLFLALTEAKHLTNVRFPEGVTSHRPPIQGQFGEFQLLLHSGDMPGTGSEEFGKVLFDTTVPAASVITIKIPGDPNGQGVWVLGDSAASVLGKTTYLL